MVDCHNGLRRSHRVRAVRTSNRDRWTGKFPGRLGTGLAAVLGAVTLAVLLFAAGCEIHPPRSLRMPTLLAQVQLARERVFVGEPFSFRVRVVGGARPDRPDVSVLRDFDVEYIRRNDRPAQRETLFDYRLKARRGGVLEIPPIPISGGGATTKTAPARIEARLPENPGAFRLVVEPEREKVYVGQQVVVQFRFECGANADNIAFDAPFLTDERFIAFVDGPLLRGLPDGYQRIVVNRGVAAARIEPDAPRGRKLLRFAAVVIPQRAGPITLASTSALATVGSLENRSGGERTRQVILQSPTGEIREAEEQRGLVLSEPAVLDVRELPRQGVPASFEGLVGRYDVRAEVVPPRITFGDPLELVVSLSGQPYLAAATIADQRNHAALLESFEVRRAGEFSVVEPDRRVFRYALRPNRSGVLAIPPIPFSYFDPDTGRYVEARSAPVDVAVAGNRVVTAADAEASSVAIPPPVADTALPRAAGGPAVDNGDPTANLPLESATVASLISSAATVLRSPLVVGGILAPPLVVLLVWLARRVVRQRLWRVSAPRELSPFEVFEKELAAQYPSGRRTLGQPHQAIQPAPEAEAPSTAFSLFRQYLGSRLGLPGSSMTFGDVAPRLRARGVSSGRCAEVQELFAVEDAARYGAGPQRDAEASLSQVRNLVSEIERELREAGRT